MAEPSLYADLSHYYDLLCSQIDYRLQCDFVIRANTTWGNGGRQCLDLACGSGSLLAHYAAAGLECAGLDISTDMLALARQRCPQAHFYHSDMSEMQLSEPQDVITCFLYSMHYCATPALIRKTFRNIFSSLKPGGLFCFDAVDKNTIANDSGHFHTLQRGDAQIRFQTRWSYSGDSDLMTLHLGISETCGAVHKHYHEQHAMAAMTIPQLREMLMLEGFAVEILEHDFARFSEWRSQKGNVIFCATRMA